MLAPFEFNTCARPYSVATQLFHVSESVCYVYVHSIVCNWVRTCPSITPAGVCAPLIDYVRRSCVHTHAHTLAHTHTSMHAAARNKLINSKSHVSHYKYKWPYDALNIWRHAPLCRPRAPSVIKCVCVCLIPARTKESNYFCACSASLVVAPQII